MTIGQVANVTDTFERRSRLVRVNGERGLRVAIRKQADANTVEVARRVLEETKRVNEEFPQVNVVPVVNQGGFIERSIENVAASALYGGALAIFVLLFFLRSLRSTIVIAVAIPISAIATFALMYFCGFTINLMTLGGLALGIGMMVDSSVVVLENIFRRRDEDREMPRVASVNGAGEVGAAILASTITTLVIFLPLVFVEGVTGVLFQELAYVVMFSLGASLIVALTVVPMLSSRLIKPPRDGGPRTLFDRLGAFGDKLFGGLDRAYRDLLRVALRVRLLVVLLAIGLLYGSTLLLDRIGSEFMPPSDEGEVTVTGRMEVGTRQDVVDRQTRRMEEIVFPAVPEMVSSVVSVGASGRNPTASARGQIQISLTPAGERKRSNLEIAEDLHQRLDGRVAGMKIRSQARQGQFLLERVLGSEDGLSVEVRGFSLETLALLAEEVARVAMTISGVQSVDLDTEEGAPQQEVRVDRAKLAAMGLTARDVTSALEIAIAGAQAGEFRVEGNSHRLFVQLADARQRSIDDVLDLTLQTQSGDQVALRNLVAHTAGRGPLVIQRRDQRRTATAAIDVAGRDMGSVAVDLQQAIDRIPRPAGYELRVTGTFEEQERAFHELMISLGLAIMLVYMVLACQYESLRDPLVVMFSVPFAAVGVLVTLFLTDTTLNVQSYIGCIMLGGIVVNNAILLVDQAGQLVRTGMPVREAVAEAGRRRLRPILMTTLTTILALLPLALGIGEGADAQAPLARAVAGGLASSTLITLLLIPCIYSLVHPDRKRSAR